MKTKIALNIVISLVLLTSLISAFGLGCAYHKNHPLELSPGQTKEVILNLQNMAGDKNVTTKPNIKKGSEIITLEDESDVFVPLGASIDVKATATVPEDAMIGDTYEIEVEFTTITVGESGKLGLGASVGRVFNVVVVPVQEEVITTEPKEITTETYITIAIIALIIFLIIWFTRKKKK